MLSNDVDAFKASLIKFGKTNDRHPETQVTIAKAESANRLLKEKNETLLQHVCTYITMCILSGMVHNMLLLVCTTSTILDSAWFRSACAYEHIDL